MENKKPNESVSKSTPVINWWRVIGIVLLIILIPVIFSNNDKQKTVSINSNPVISETSAIKTNDSDISKEKQQKESAINTDNSVKGIETPKQEVTKIWHIAETYSGDTKIQTSPFSMKGSQWRVSYNCTPTDSTNGFSGSIGFVDKQLIANSFAMSVKCPKSNTSYVYAQDPGDYYLDLDSVYAHYSVTVEDYY